jgi:CubicO group peptidase (beta-lactamase class C family)
MLRALRPLALIVSLALAACSAPSRTAATAASSDDAKRPAVQAALQAAVDKPEMAGAVALVARRDGPPLVVCAGVRDLATKAPMTPDTVFQIASMTKPVTATAVLMLEEDGKLSIDDPVEKHLPAFKGQLLLQSKSSDTVTLVKPPRPITLRDLLTHTSGLPGDYPPGIADLYKRRHLSLAEAVLVSSQRPLQFEPGTKWSYCNAGIDTLGRVVEAVSGMPYETFLAERLFKPLGMADTFFYVTPDRRDRIARIYKVGKEKLEPVENFIGDPVAGEARFPVPAGGLYSTAADYATFGRMMLDGGVHAGKRILKAETVAKMTANGTGDLKAGFTPGMGMGLGFQVVVKPEGVTAMLSPGTFGHGGAFGTQGWFDPVKGVAYVLMVQRTGIPNGDASDLRKAFQAAAGE